MRKILLQKILSRKFSEMANKKIIVIGGGDAGSGF